MRPAIHVGYQIQMDMDDTYTSLSRLASILGVTRTHLRDILEGRKGITRSDALRLSMWQNVSFEYWLALQSNYDILIAAGSENVTGRKVA